MASFPRLSPLASAAALVSIVLGEEAATLSSWMLIPRSTVKANMNSSHSPQRGHPRGTDGLPAFHTQRQGDGLGTLLGPDPSVGQRSAVRASSDRGEGGEAKQESTRRGHVKGTPTVSFIPTGSCEKQVIITISPGRQASCHRLRGTISRPRPPVWVGRILCRVHLVPRRVLGSTPQDAEHPRVPQHPRAP